MLPTAHTLDFGNTNPHVGIFQNEKLIEVLPLNELRTLSSKAYEASIAAQSSVVKFASPTKEYSTLIKVSDYFFENQFLDMKVNYSRTLGEDRLVQAYYLFKLSPTPKILIDAGSFITVDFICEKGFKGGYILPGLKLLKESYAKGQQLSKPKNLEILKKSHLPNSTESAITQGLGLLVQGGLEKAFKFFEGQSPEVYLTGGSSKELETLLSDLDTKLEPYLIHHSLYYLLRKCL